MIGCLKRSDGDDASAVLKSSKIFHFRFQLFGHKKTPAHSEKDADCSTLFLGTCVWWHALSPHREQLKQTLGLYAIWTLMLTAPGCPV